MIFIVEPGATSAVSAKSLKPSLLAMARILPVDGWMTTIELLLCMSTAACAAALGLRADRGGDRLDVLRVEDDRLAVLDRRARRGLDLDVKARLALARAAPLHQQVRDVGEPGVAVGGQVPAAGVGDHADLGRRPGPAARWVLAVRFGRHHVGLPGDVPDASSSPAGRRRARSGSPTCRAAGRARARRHRGRDRVRAGLPRQRGRGSGGVGDAGQPEGDLAEAQPLGVGRERGLGGGRVIGEVRRLGQLALLPVGQERGRDLPAVLLRVEPVGIMPVAGTPGPRLITKTAVSATATTTARLPAIAAMRTLRRFPGS